MVDLATTPRSATRERPAGSSVGALLLALLLLAGCGGDELRPLEPEGGEMFRSYAALGNSITAGFQSGGINDSTQRASYAAMVAEAMGTEFGLPLLRAPGCPPPLVNVFTGERVGGAGPDACRGRVTPPPPVVRNVAVPGASVIDALRITGEEATPNALTTFILGGRTQLEAALEADPTFASVWLGNNDVLTAALTGDTTVMTRPPTFAARYAAVADSLDGAGLEGAVLVGIPDVTLIPHLSPGSAYYAADQEGAFPPTFSVDSSCSPSQLGDVTLVPFGYAFGELLPAARDSQFVELDCAADPPVLDAAEIQAVRRTVAAYNEAIGAEAEERGWAFVNPNPTLRQLAQQGEIPLFPNTFSPAAVERPFGELFSKDGIHPARPLHRRMATLVVEAINTRYGTDLTPPGS